MLQYENSGWCVGMSPTAADAIKNRPSSRQTFWLVKAGKPQVWLTTLTMALFYSVSKEVMSVSQSVMQNAYGWHVSITRVSILQEYPSAWHLLEQQHKHQWLIKSQLCYTSMNLTGRGHTMASEGARGSAIDSSHCHSLSQTLLKDSV